MSMMNNDANAILDDILSRWHGWARGHSLVPVTSVDPVFRNARSGGRCWDSVDDVIDAEINASVMRAIDFEVGEMAEPHRTAVHVMARNCYTGVSVWRSPRLDMYSLAEREVIVLEARNQITRRLILVGVL